MPRLPSAELYAVPNTSRPVVSVDLGAGGRTLEDAGAGFARVARTLGDVAQQKQQVRDRLNMSRAKGHMFSARIAALRAIEEENDYSKYESIYDEHVQRGRADARELLTDEDDQALFDIEAENEIEQGRFEVFRRAEVREGVDIRATLTADLDRLGTDALSGDANQFVQAWDRMTDLIEGSTDRPNGLDRAEAAELLIDRRDKMALRYFTSQPVLEQDAMLKDPKNPIVAGMAPDVVQKLRDAVLGDLALLETASRAAESQRRINVGIAAINAIDGGAVLADVMHTPGWELLTEAQRKDIRDYATADTVLLPDHAAWVDMVNSTLTPAGKKAFLDKGPVHSPWFSRFTQAQQKQAVEYWQSMREGNEAPKAMEDQRATNQLIEDTMVQMLGSRYEATIGKDTSDSVQKARIQFTRIKTWAASRIADEENTYFRLNQRPMPGTEKRELAERLTTQIPDNYDRAGRFGGWFGRDVGQEMIDPRDLKPEEIEERFTIEDYDSIPDVYRRAIERRMKSSGKTFTSDLAEKHAILEQYQYLLHQTITGRAPGLR